MQSNVNLGGVSSPPKNILNQKAGIFIKIVLITAAVVVFVAVVAFAVYKLNNPKKIVPVADENGRIIAYFLLRENSSNDMAEDFARRNYRFLLEESNFEYLTPDFSDKTTKVLDENKRKMLEEELLLLIENRSLNDWDGFDERIEVFDDFHSFSLEITYSDGTKITAKGDHVFPDDYRDIRGELMTIFSKYAN